MPSPSVRIFPAAEVSWHLTLNILVLPGNLITWEIRAHGWVLFISASMSESDLLPTESSTCLTRSVRFANSSGGITGARLIAASLARASSVSSLSMLACLSQTAEKPLGAGISLVRGTWRSPQATSSTLSLCTAAVVVILLRKILKDGVFVAL